MNKHQSGFSLIAVLLLLASITLIIGAGWYIWNQNKQTNNHDKSQAERSQPAVNNSSSNPEAEEEIQAYLDIPEWGIKIPISPESIDRFTYKISAISQTGEQTLTITDQDILAVEKIYYESVYGVSEIISPCAANQSIARSSDGLFTDGITGERQDPNKAWNNYTVKQVQNYYYVWLRGQGCGYEQSFTEEVDELYQNGGLSSLNQDLSNLEPIQE